MTKKAILISKERANRIDEVYGQGRRDQVAARTDLYPTIITPEDLTAKADALRDVSVAFGTWGMPLLSAEQLDLLPALEAVFYAAGTVKYFAQPLLDRDILVCSAWAANGVPVAEYTLSQILLANKDFFRNVRRCATHAGRVAPRDTYIPGNFGETVALLGAGVIGRKLIELLQPFNLRIIVWDPFLSDEQAAALGVYKVETLGEAFSQGYVVSNHLANVPATVGLLTGDHFALMREHATFINTGRGATVVEPDLIRVMTERPDLMAILDVTWPEPPLEGSPLYDLENVLLTQHIAGSLGDEVVRLADYMIEEFDRWEAGQPLRYQVTKEMLATMA